MRHVGSRPIRGCRSEHTAPTGRLDVPSGECVTVLFKRSEFQVCPKFYRARMDLVSLHDISQAKTL